MSRDPAGPSGETDPYADHLSRARAQIDSREFEAARDELVGALAMGADRPEAYNLLGVVDFARGQRDAAQKWWRMALEADATYVPARENLHRSSRHPAPAGGLCLG